LDQRVAADLEVASGRASVGGGAFADAELPSCELQVRAWHRSGSDLLARLRRGEPAVVARIKDETVHLDMRCVVDAEVEALAQAVETALAGGGGR
jgi:L-seryl-tRNA(Ser) seleniumtransferase